MPSINEMRALGWQDPRAPDYLSKHTLILKRHGISLRVHEDEVGIVELLLDTLVDARSQVWLTARADDWGITVRPIRGTTASADADDSWSYHCWNAVDLNAVTNPSVSSPAAGHSDMPHRAIHRLQAQIHEMSRGKVELVYGGDWSSPFDPMHFELHGRREDVAALSKAIHAGKAKVPVRRRTVRLGNAGHAVRRVQKLLRDAGVRVDGKLVKVDGDFGEITERAVRKFQAKHGLVTDGVVGSRTYRALGRAARA